MTKVSSEGHKRVMLAARPGMMEYQAMSIFQYYCYMYGGCREMGYIPICPSGDRFVNFLLGASVLLFVGDFQQHLIPGVILLIINSSFRHSLRNGVNMMYFLLFRTKILHYGGQSAPNDYQIKDGDLCLFDMGAEYHCYVTDITTTFPVNGKFTDVQKTTYEMVLNTVHSVVNRIRPGTVTRVNSKVIRNDGPLHLYVF